MKALTVEHLQTILDSELLWRKKEISSLIILAKGSGSVERNSIIRACVPLMYAHWEGFGRACFTRYLEFVSFKRMKFKNLSPSFIYLASIPSLTGISAKPAHEGLEIVLALMNRVEKTNKDSFRKRVNTKSNLRWDVLCELLTICGFQPAEFSQDQDFLDREICDARNEIAHGNGGAPSLDVLIARRDRIIALMARLQATVVNAALNEAYKRAA